MIAKVRRFLPLSLAVSAALAGCAGPAAESATVSASGKVRPPGFPEARPACNSCHEAGSPRLKGEANAVCTACHVSAHGAQGMGKAGEEGEPGQKERAMSCLTCHDPHKAHEVP